MTSTAEVARTVAPSRPGSLREIWEHRELVANLTRRDLKARYKKSLLGWLWSLINPASSLLIYTIVFGLILGGQAPKAGNGHLASFPLYLFTGLVVWNAFASSFTGTLGALPDAGPLLTKVYFPPAAPCLAAVAGVIFQHVVELVILVGVLIVLGNVGWTFLLIPFLSALLLVFGMGLGMIGGLLQARYRDIGYLVGIGLQFTFYATPIVYSPANFAGKKLGGRPAEWWLNLNPMTHFVAAMRDLVYHLRLPSLGSVAVMLAWSTVSIVGGWLIFHRYAPDVIEEL